MSKHCALTTVRQIEAVQGGPWPAARMHACRHFPQDGILKERGTPFKITTLEIG